MTQIPIQKEVIDRIAANNKINNPGKASIREMRKMIQDVESETGVRFVKMAPAFRNTGYRCRRLILRMVPLCRR